MLESMTGFGRGTAEVPSCRIVVEVRTLNSKSLDLAGVRLPTRYREYEMWARGELQRRVGRGKVDLAVSSEWNDGFSGTLPVLDAAGMASMVRQMGQAVAQGEAPVLQKGELTLVALHHPGVWESLETPLSPDEGEALQLALGQALDGLMDFRQAEGQATARDLRNQLQAIRQQINAVAQLKDARIDSIRGRIREALALILEPGQPGFDEQRFAQELVYHIERLDINEELSRLAQHCAYFEETLSQPESQGRKLAFIAQEMGREINTIGSKSNFAPMQRMVVEMKDRLERIKEQLLNVV